MPKEALEPLAALAEFFGSRPQVLAGKIIGGFVREMYGAIGEDALQRFARLESARLLKTMTDEQRRRAHYKHVTTPGLDLDDAEADWAAAVALADSTTADEIVAAIARLRAEARRRLATVPEGLEALASAVEG